MKNRLRLFLVTTAAAPFALCAALVPTTPIDDSQVALVPEIQKKIMKFPTHAERLQELNRDRDRKQSYFASGAEWRKATPVTFRWECTDDESGPYRVLVSETPDFADPIIGLVSGGHHLTMPNETANFKINQKYYWKVIGRDKSKNKVESEVAAFVTEDQTPRWIAIKGDVRNIRDLGGYKTTDGKRVKQGKVFRGQGLNYNSVDGEIPGANRLMLADKDYMLNKLGIRTDLDLRSGGETAYMKVSPLGEEVNFVHHSSAGYAGIFEPHGKEVMAENFRLFCNEANYPIYFHCIAGADRTGSLAYVLNGVLGVPEKDLGADWEHTFYPNLPDNNWNGNPNHWQLIQHIDNGLAKYGDKEDTLQRRIELYLLDCGVTPEEIETFRSIMLED